MLAQRFYCHFHSFSINITYREPKQMETCLGKGVGCHQGTPRLPTILVIDDSSGGVKSPPKVTEDVFGPINSFYFSVKLEEGMQVPHLHESPCLHRAPRKSTDPGLAGRQKKSR